MAVGSHASVSQEVQCVRAVNVVRRIVQVHDVEKLGNISSDGEPRIHIDTYMDRRGDFNIDVES